MLSRPARHAPIIGPFKSIGYSPKFWIDPHRHSSRPKLLQANTCKSDFKPIKQLSVEPPKPADRNKKCLSYFILLFKFMDSSNWCFRLRPLLSRSRLGTHPIIHVIYVCQFFCWLAFPNRSAFSKSYFARSNTFFICIFLLQIYFKYIYFNIFS